MNINGLTIKPLILSKANKKLRITRMIVLNALNQWSPAHVLFVYQSNVNVRSQS